MLRGQRYAESIRNGPKWTTRTNVARHTARINRLCGTLHGNGFSAGDMIISDMFHIIVQFAQRIHTYITNNIYDDIT